MKKFIQNERLPVKIDQLPVLWCLKNHGILCQQEVADMTLRDKSSVQRTITNLQHKGVIRVQQDKTDKRKNLLTLTELGRAVTLKIASFKFKEPGAKTGF